MTTVYVPLLPSASLNEWMNYTIKFLLWRICFGGISLSNMYFALTPVNALHVCVSHRHKTWFSLLYISRTCHDNSCCLWIAHFHAWYIILFFLPPSTCPGLCVSLTMTSHTQRRMFLAVYKMDSAIATRTYGNQSLVASVCATLEPSCAMKLSARS